MSLTIKRVKTDKSINTRPVYKLQAIDLSKIVCHRRRGGSEEYLVKWKPKPTASSRSQAICSWHALDELSYALHLVQSYLATREKSKAVQKAPAFSLLPQNSRKRKSPGADPVTSRDETFGILTPATTSDISRGSSASAPPEEGEVSVYNGLLERKEGWIVAKADNRNRHRQTDQVVNIDARTLPTPQMIRESLQTPTTQAERAVRTAFYSKVKRVPNLSLENKVDSTTPSLDFQFIKDYVLRDGVYRADPETCEGCQKPCRPNMGQNVGCEYPRSCACLEYAAVHESLLEKEEPERFQEYVRQKAAGEYIDTSHLPKRFPYHKPKGENTPQTLQAFYRESRHPIYECNANCDCGAVCKSRVVQKGRKVALTIFKTANRGWGLKCDEDLIQGEFIDTYRGEIITNAEADERETKAGSKEKSSYLYSLDKFIGDDPDLTAETCYVVDGQYMGGPTRFINHSCEPNCRQFTVSYNKHDPRVYDLAFFAIEDIPQGTELTFDYLDKNEEEEEDVIREREQAARDPKNLDKVPCNCGARKCRGYLWV